MNVDLSPRLVLLCLLLCSAHVAGAPLSVILSGLEGEAQSNVSAALSIASKDGQELRPRTVRQLHADAEMEIRRALQPFGYYQPSIEADLQAPGEQGGWRASYKVDVGPAVAIAAQEIEFTGAGSADAEVQALLQDWPLNEGQALEHQRWMAARDALLDGVRQLGYRDAVLALHRVEVDIEAYAASIALQGRYRTALRVRADKFRNRLSGSEFPGAFCGAGAGPGFSSG